MRRNLAKIPYPVIGRATAVGTAAGSSISVGFSTSSAGGGGRGRGGFKPFDFTVGAPSKNESDDSKFEDAPPPPPPPPHGRGRGRGQRLPSSPGLSPFASFLNHDPKAPPNGRGRGFAPPNIFSPPPRNESDSTSRMRPPPKPSIRAPLTAPKDKEGQIDSSESEFPARHEEKLPSEISSVLEGAGRGKPIKPTAAPSEKPKLENRHIRRQPRSPAPNADSPREQLSQEEKVKRAMGILTRGDPDGGRGAISVTRGRGRGRGRGSIGRIGRGRGEDRYEESDDEPVDLELGTPQDEEKLAKKLGPKIMNELAEGFVEMSNRVLPSPADDAYLDALHTNLLIECEPEYLMEEFGTNPDIDEKPPIPLREALEKMKPFLMAYEGIESQEEWEEIMEETMKTTVPLMKEIVDYYSGPNRVTAKQQHEELERVAKTLPANAPSSVKRFTDRALLSLQSNPGWGFDKKCQFMDKLVMEVSKQYK